MSLDASNHRWSPFRASRLAPNFAALITDASVHCGPTEQPGPHERVAKAGPTKAWLPFEYRYLSMSNWVIAPSGRVQDPVWTENLTLALRRPFQDERRLSNS
jgi:hypothetical protein